MENWEICAENLSLGFQGDNDTQILAISTDLTEGWNLKIDVDKDGEKNILQLSKDGNVYYVILKSSMLADSGQYIMQVRGTLGDKVKHSNLFFATVNHSVNAPDAYPPPVPSEFTQIEERITAINDNPPKPGPNGYWMIYNPDSAQYEESDVPLPEGGEFGYQIGDGLKVQGNTLMVDAADAVEQDNTLPITSAAVYTTVGNIEILLGTI